MPERRPRPPTTESGRLSARERRLYFVLAAPALGLALTATTLASYLPVLARTLTQSHLVIGGLVGGDGLVALALPVWIGAASDRVRTRLGRRLPFVLAGAPVAALSLVLLPFGRSIAILAVEVFVFYSALYSYQAPYRALYSDLVPHSQSGRSQGIQGTFRAAGMGSALIGGALLMPLWRPLPYFVAAAVLLATTGVLWLGLRSVPLDRADATTPPGSAPSRVWALVRDHPDIRKFVVANALWQVTEGGLKTFIVLYLTRGLHKSFAFSAAAMGIVAGAAIVVSPIAGKLADRFGALRVMRILIAAFGIGLWLPTFSRSTALLLCVLPLVGTGGAMALSLPYAILMQAMPERSHGSAAGLFNLSSGVGTLLGPLLAGGAIDALRPLFRSTDGYAAMWPVIGTASLLSLPLLRHARRPKLGSSGRANEGARGGARHDDRGPLDAACRP